MGSPRISALVSRPLLSLQPLRSLTAGNSSNIEITEEKRQEIERLVVQAGISFDGQGELGGWTGGSLWLVPTYKPIQDWKPIAERKLVADDDY
jgi:hypothetical protein